MGFFYLKVSDAPRDNNRIPTLLGTSSAGDRTPVDIYADPTTHRLLVDATFDYTGIQDDEAVDGDNYGTLILGTDGTNYQILAVNASGHLLVDLQDTSIAVTGTVTSNQGGAPWTMDLTKVAGESVQVAGGTEAKSIRVTIANDSTGLLSVDDNNSSLSIDIGGQAPQLDDTDKLAVSLYGKGTTAGDTAVDVDTDGHLQVDVLTAPTTAVTGTFWQATQPVSIAAAVAVTQSGTWDEVGINDSGNSITVDAPQGTPVFVRLSDGTNPIATLPVSLASVPSHAVTNAGTFAVQPGSALTGPANPTIDSYAHAAISTAANTANQSLVDAPGANKQIWVYGISYVVGTAAGTVSFQDEDDTAISGIMAHALNSGMAVSPSGNFAMPLWKVATNKALEVDTVTCDIEGFLQYAIVSV